MKTGGILQ